MEIIESRSPENFADLASQWCLEKIAHYQARRVFLPSGGTPQSLYEKWENEQPPFLSDLELTQLDEVLTGVSKGRFSAFFRAHLPSYFSQFVPLEKQEGLPDLVILGLGVIVHVGFHEPHVPRDFFKGIVELSDETCRRLGDAPGVKALSYGVGCFLRAKAILLLIRGPDKEKITRAFFDDPNATFPAALLRAHPDFTVIVSH